MMYARIQGVGSYVPENHKEKVTFKINILKKYFKKNERLGLSHPILVLKALNLNLTM